MTTNHTPGPWAHRNGRIYSVDREYLTIANVARTSDGDFSPANGRVLAAAPELLEALEWAHMALIGYLPGHRNATTDAAIDAARDAIAKAKGGEQPQHNAGLPRAASWPITPVEYLAQRLREDDEDLQDLMDRDMGG